MSITFEIASSDGHFEQILQLQQENHLSAISPQQRTKEGFLSVRHDLSLLKEMSAQAPQTIALYQDQVIGYNLAMLTSMKNMVPGLTPLFDELEACQYEGRFLKAYKIFVGGQVCVSKAFRGQNLLSRLYHAAKEALSKDYELCVTEVAVANTVSLAAHKKMGFETIHTYHDGLQQWDIVVWKLR